MIRVSGQQRQNYWDLPCRSGADATSETPPEIKVYCSDAATSGGNLLGRIATGLRIAGWWLAFACLQTVSSHAVAGDLVYGATITTIAGATSNLDQFTIGIAGGTGPCVGQYITFPVSSAPSQLAWATVFSLATTAMKNGNLIRVYNYVDNDCSKATFLQVFK